MRPTLLLTAFFGILLAGCTLRGKPAKTMVVPAAPTPVAIPAPAPPPPAPLSIPQTRVELPKPQAVDPAALVTETTQPEPPPVAAPARPRRTTPAPGPPAIPAATPPAATATPVEPRPNVQEIVPTAELKRLRESVPARKREVTQILEQLSRRTLSNSQQNVADTVRSFLALSDEAWNRDDFRQADALAERAQILAKELQSGK